MASDILDVVSRFLSENLVQIIGVAALLITTYIALLNYRGRPVIQQAVERHSDDLKSVLGSWVGRLPTERAWDTGRLGVLDEDSLRRRLTDVEEHVQSGGETEPFVEESPLFEDLENHLKPKIFQDWKMVKEAASQLELEKLRLWRDIKNRLVETLELPFVGEQELGGFNRSFVDQVYRSMPASDPTSDIRQRGHRFHEHEDHSDLILGGTVVAHGEKEDLESLYPGLLEALPDIQNSMQAATGSLPELEIKLTDSVRSLKNQIEEYLALPLIPNKCDLIKGATKGH